MTLNFAGNNNNIVVVYGVGGATAGAVAITVAVEASAV
jgi:hypothetical protein